jgi:hypothetical protein
MPRLLELCSGTGSIGKAFGDRGWEVVSLDIDPKSKPTIVADIREWDYTTFPKGHFQFVWGSPLCTFYSRARTLRISTEEELDYADSLMQKTLEIAEYSRTHWAFENPQTGSLKTRPFMLELGLLFRDVTYCKYGLRYKKQTRIWNNLDDHWQPQPVCCRSSRCEHFANNHHPATAQRGPCRCTVAKRVGNDFTQNQLYHIPAALCDEIARAAESALGENADAHQKGASMELR